MEVTWTISELAAAAAAALSGERVQVNGRIRDMPNERLIRWYTTIGLVDPPLARRGRVALYGQRHLLQLVAVKRRQAANRTIAQIQAELTGATDEFLRSVAKLPSPASAPSDTAQTSGRPTGRRRFWAGLPASSPDLAMPTTAARPPAAPLPAPAMPSPAMPTATGAATEAVTENDAQIVHGVRLAPGITLLIDGSAPSAEDIYALQAAALPLLEELWHRGLPRPAPSAGSASSARTARAAPATGKPPSEPSA